MTHPSSMRAVPVDAENDIELSVVMPCLNEAETLGVCIEKALGFMERAGVQGEVIVADNGSSDGSQEIARGAGARVVDIDRRGYGAALMGGFLAARGRYIVMGDSDDSYDFSSLDGYLERLRAGDELVMGNRFKGGVAKGAMPRLHRYFGNPFLTFAGRSLFGSPIGDFQCGLRGFSREAMLGVGLRAQGMEFASEMVMKSSLFGLRIGEVPTKLVPDGRSRPPHIRSWRDGWRNMRLLLMHRPLVLFTLPGALALIAGLALMALTILGGGAAEAGDAVALVAAGGLVILGVQTITFGSFARRFGEFEGHLPRAAKASGGGESDEVGQPKWLLERRLFVGFVLFALGVGGLLWGEKSPLHVAESAVGGLGWIVPSVTVMVVGAQLALFGFVAEFVVLGQRRNDD